jgi:predicted transcriptional regulator
MKEALDLFFELSSDDRDNILNALQTKPHKLTELSTKTGLPNQEVSRQLVRLSNLDLCFRDGEGMYNLTPYAEAVLKIVPGFEFLSKYRSYFRTHTASMLPIIFQERLGELLTCTPISDAITNQYEVQQLIMNAEKYIWSITEQGNLTNAKLVEEAITRGVENRIMTPDDVAPSEAYIDYVRHWSTTPNHPFKSSRASRKFLEKINIGLIVSEKEAAQILFPTTEGKLDYAGFKANNTEALRWCHDLFNHYWETGKGPSKRLSDLFGWSV